MALTELTVKIVDLTDTKVHVQVVHSAGADLISLEIGDNLVVTTKEVLQPLIHYKKIQWSGDPLNE